MTSRRIRHLGWICLLLLLAVAVWLRPDGGEPLAVRENLVVIGLDMHDAPAAATGAILVSDRTDCAAYDWASLAIGRPTTTGEVCYPQATDDGALEDWRSFQQLSADELGGIADTSPTCVAAVGPAAVLPAANGQGHASVYDTEERFLAAGAPLNCPVTFIDASEFPEEIIAAVTAHGDATVIVAELGDRPVKSLAAFGADPGLLGGDTAGLVTWSDLRATVVDHLTGDGHGDLRVSAGDATRFRDAAGHLQARALAWFIAGMVLVAAVVLVRAGRGIGWTVLAALPSGLFSTGAVDWWRTPWPVPMSILTLLLLVTAWAAAIRWWCGGAAGREDLRGLVFALPLGVVALLWPTGWRAANLTDAGGQLAPAWGSALLLVACVVGLLTWWRRRPAPADEVD